jgi:hypothetical protein
MARAIIRFSLDGVGASTVGTRAEAKSALEQVGFESIGTSSYEADNPNQTVLVDGLRQALDIFEHAPAGVSLDHLWIYLDSPPGAAQPNGPST